MQWRMKQVYGKIYEMWHPLLSTKEICRSYVSLSIQLTIMEASQALVDSREISILCLFLTMLWRWEQWLRPNRDRNETNYVLAKDSKKGRSA